MADNIQWETVFVLRKCHGIYAEGISSPMTWLNREVLGRARFGPEKNQLTKSSVDTWRFDGFLSSSPVDHHLSGPM
jgi:hypothetical protein